MRSFRMFLAPALALTFATAPACVGADRELASSISDDDDGDESDCTKTQGYWKNHPEAWPVTSLTLGVHVYTQADLLAIFDTPVAGNGLVALSHQLIAAKLNVAAGAPDLEIAATIDAADTLIGDLVPPPVGDGYLHPSLTSELNDLLDAFNRLGPDDCEPAPGPVCGDGVLDEGEACDDGNADDGDGCSAACEVEVPPPPPPACGDGVLDEGEACDDGNTEDGDGCSEICEVELPPPPEPVCGNGVVEPGEQCDDGNTDDNDTCTNECIIITG